MTRFLIIIFTVIFFVPGLMLAENKQDTSQTPQSTQSIKELEARENVSNQLKNLADLLMGVANKKYTDCLKAFGNESFCQCLRDKSPSGISFAEYVSVVITPKEELGYSKADEQTKGIIDNTLKTREICVGALK